MNVRRKAVREAGCAMEGCWRGVAVRWKITKEEIRRMEKASESLDVVSIDGHEVLETARAKRRARKAQVFAKA